MVQERRSILSSHRNLAREGRISWFLELVAALLLACVAEPATSQIAPDQMMDGKLRGQQLVSKNELLTPAKALKATDRARKDLLRGRQDSARKEIQEALDIAPHCALALSLQGIVRYEDKDYVQASQSFQQSINEDPTLVASYLGLGSIFIRQGRFREALIPLDRADALLPSSWFSHYQTAIAYLGLRDSVRALKEIGNAEPFAENDAEKRSGVALLRGMAYLQLKNYGVAKESFQQAVKVSPNGAYAPIAHNKLEQLKVVIEKADSLQVGH